VPRAEFVEVFKAKEQILECADTKAKDNVWLLKSDVDEE
jgi:hypothetical protein